MWASIGSYLWLKSTKWDETHYLAALCAVKWESHERHFVKLTIPFKSVFD